MICFKYSSMNILKYSLLALSSLCALAAEAPSLTNEQANQAIAQSIAEREKQSIKSYGKD